MSPRFSHHAVDAEEDSDFGAEGFLSDAEAPVPPPRPRAHSTSTQIAGSPAVNIRVPTRSFYHRSFHGTLDAAHYSSHGVREQTAELAAFASFDPSVEQSANQDRGSDSHSERPTANADFSQSLPPESTGHARLRARPEAIREVSEPVTPESSRSSSPSEHPTSNIAKMLKKQGPEAQVSSTNGVGKGLEPRVSTNVSRDDAMAASEETPLLTKMYQKRDSHKKDLESQKYQKKGLVAKSRAASRIVVDGSMAGAYTLSHPGTWSPRKIWQRGVVEPIKVLPAVFLGLLLNLLDALSYGMILFPLGTPIFAEMGPVGISMFYVSTIISQVVFSSGGSIFKGGIGSEMIEVVPFMHKMALTILATVGDDNPRAVLATTILAFSVSSVLTGAVFFFMGTCRLGALIGFFPRHILIGCIGGVGFFLVMTGLEVSARLDGNLTYDFPTLHKLFQLDTVFLWTVPLALAIILMTMQRFVKSNFLVGGYFLTVALLFYFFKFALRLNIQNLRDNGWVFGAPVANNPWYHFYSLYDFRLVRWDALLESIPAMFALTFFGILHVPINVPALAISTGEDNLNLDRELIAHGISNALSGFCGSIQNYLVYTNSLLFIDSGGNSRLAGLLLAAATAGVLFAGPVIIGYIPIMVVGALIFLLGIELMQEALVDTWGRVHRLEYATILIIVVTMGAWDFVVGICVGILLACVNYVVQTSRKSAIRASYSGKTATSTVRRPPVQLRYLREAGQQTHAIKLTGFLFFGTIVGVESRIRALLEEDAFRDRPIRYLILDLAHIYGVDFSAAEAFTRIGRLLKKRDVVMVVSGVDLCSEIGESLGGVGLFDDVNEVELFEDLNQALEFCENELLQTLYLRQAQMGPHPQGSRSTSKNLDIPSTDSRPLVPTEVMFSSPRQHHLHQVASTTLTENPRPHAKGWHNFKPPLPLILQAFEDLSQKGEDFWYRAARFFEHKEFGSGMTLTSGNDERCAFYLLEEGILRADYNSLPGQFSELIMAGRPCGELPFFSETGRPITLTAERDCVVWELSEEKWTELQQAVPDVASEILKISLKLTRERMEAVLGYILTAAG